MSKQRRNWGEGFALGLLIGIVAAASYLAGRPAPARAGNLRLPGTASARRLAKSAEQRDAMLLADSPSPSVH